MSPDEVLRNIIKLDGIDGAFHALVSVWHSVVMADPTHGDSEVRGKALCIMQNALEEVEDIFDGYDDAKGIMGEFKVGEGWIEVRKVAPYTIKQVQTKTVLTPQNCPVGTNVLCCEKTSGLIVGGIYRIKRWTKWFDEDTFILEGFISAYDTSHFINIDAEIEAMKKK